MKRVVGLIVAVALGSAGCGDGAGSEPLSSDELVAGLRALGVTVEEGTLSDADAEDLPVGLRYYVLHFTQPIDHKDPGLGTFEQKVSLLHRDDRAPNPMIVYTSGYGDAWGGRAVELTRLLAGNQVSIEHRFFGTSVPHPTDWTKLTIEQMAADEHEIITALRTIYGGAFLTTGTSKGGMTAVFHRRFYPDDVEGTVPYVAPLSFNAPDPRYQMFFDQIGKEPCRSAVRNVALELLTNRREPVRALAEQQTGHSYTRVTLDAAVESAIVSLEWAFWQNRGAAFCKTVPVDPQTASTESLFAFLETTSRVSVCDDRAVVAYAPYYYQAHAQLGYPEAEPAYLRPWMTYGDDDYLGELPTTNPTFDSNAMRDVVDFVEDHGDRLLFIYGAWDPWTAGKFPLGRATHSVVLVQPEANHKAQLLGLSAEDRATAFAMLEEWTGVAPVPSRVPPAMAAREPTMELPPRVHALHAAGK